MPTTTKPKTRFPDAKRDKIPSPAKLRAMLDKAGLTYADAADHVGMSQRTLERYLADSANPRMPYPLFFTLRALCTGAPAYD